MASRSKPNPLATSLEELHKVTQDGKITVIKSSSISRAHRERLQRNGFLEEIIRGWLAVNSRPGPRKRIDEAWSTVFWEFSEAYLNDRFGDDWSLSPENSVAVLAGNQSIPPQLIIRSPLGGNELLSLPGGTSMFFHRTPVPTSSHRIDGLRVMSAEDALINLAPHSWKSMQTDVVSVLASIRGTRSVHHELLSESRTSIAGRMAGALRAIERERDADAIISTMRAAGLNPREENPFEETANLTIGLSKAGTNPAATRIRLLWAKMRDDGLRTFDLPVQPINDKDAYLTSVDDRYVSDAYNSLSIEGYHVSPDLIERVRSGAWNPDQNTNDWNMQNALAAKGYWEAFKAVKEDIGKIISGEPAGPLLYDRHQEWFRQMFSPSVEAGILPRHALAGYRGHPIYLRGSNHVPTPHSSISDAIEVLFECAEIETDPRAKATLAPFLFTYIHPFHDGNGRIARFLMNAFLAEGGFPWTIVPYDRRDEYLATLESASQDQNIQPLASLVKELVSSPPPRPKETAYKSSTKSQDR